MTPSRPPFSLLTLQIFISVARLGSFTRAADALALTQSTISKHVSLLETELGVPLFTRTGGVAPTQAGIAFLETIEPALQQIWLGVEQVRAKPAQKATVTFLAPPAVMQYWLVPLLPRFAAEHPDIDLQMRPRLLSGSASRADVDADIRFGNGTWQGVKARYLFGREMCVVASPALCQRLSLRNYADLMRAPLLRHVLYPSAWPEWVAAIAPGLNLKATGPEYEHYSILLEAVQAELGVAIVPRILLRKALASGDLEAPFNEVMLGSSAYYLVLRDAASQARAVSIAGDWLLARARETAHELLAAAAAPTD